nr:hypothetical protein [uncultured Chitinophaga sp.]
MDRIAFSRKLVVCLITGLVVGASFRRLTSRFVAHGVALPVVSLLAYLLLMVFLLTAVVWHYRERRHPALSLHWLPVIQGILLYTLAIDLCTFGWNKIYHLQMVVPLGQLDIPFSALSGEELTWAYFGWSYPYMVAIAIMQMTCALLLLWRRTRLLGLIMIVPVLLNIILMDTFYRMPPGVLLHALILMSGVAYLLAVLRRPLVEFFLRRDWLPIGSGWGAPVKWLLRAGVAVIPFMLNATYDYPNHHPELTGKYIVRQLTVNHIPCGRPATGDSLLTKVFMDLENDFVLEFNDWRRRYIGTYEYHPWDGRISARWRYPAGVHEAFAGTLKSDGKKGTWRFKGILGKDTVEMQLVKVKR